MSTLGVRLDKCSIVSTQHNPYLNTKLKSKCIHFLKHGSMQKKIVMWYKIKISLKKHKESIFWPIQYNHVWLALQQCVHIHNTWNSRQTKYTKQQRIYLKTCTLSLISPSQAAEQESPALQPSHSSWIDLQGYEWVDPWCGPQMAGVLQHSSTLSLHLGPVQPALLLQDAH